MARVLQFFVACFLSTGGVMVSAAEFPDYHFVHTSGEAFVHVVPDIGEVTFDLKASDPNAEVAFSRVNQRITELQALMSAQSHAQGLSIGDVKRELIAAKDGNPESTMFKCSVRIRVEDLNKWKFIITPILTMTDVDKLTVFYDATKRDEIETQLLLEASKNARKRAEILAGSFGRKIVSASAITDGQLRNLTSSIGLVTNNANTNRIKRMEAAVDLSDTTVIRFAKSVDVVFRTK